jgi:hypothetical protein
MSNGLAMLRPPMSDRVKDVEILALRHQITVLERQLHAYGRKVRFAPSDRAFLAALRLLVQSVRLDSLHLQHRGGPDQGG